MNVDEESKELAEPEMKAAHAAEFDDVTSEATKVSEAVDEAEESKTAVVSETTEAVKDASDKNSDSDAHDNQLKETTEDSLKPQS